MAESFTHLHVHTEYSMLDGAARIADVVGSAVADGQPAIGITDHGNMYGILDFYKECQKQGVKPILGSELYMAHEHRSERPARRGRMDDSGGDSEGGKKLYYHLTALAETNEGYRNLIQLSSRAYLEGYWYKPKCLLPGQEIVTSTGRKRVEDIEVGDLVLTHRGRLRPVTQVMSRHHDGPVHGIELNNRYGRITWLTGEHPVLVRHQDGSRSWVAAGNIEAGRSRRTEALSAWRSFACLPKLRPDSPVTRVRASDYIAPEWTHDGTAFVKVVPRRRIGPTRCRSWMEDDLLLDVELGAFIGLYAAEGATNGAEVRLSLHEDEVWLVDSALRAIKRLTGKDATVSRRQDRPGYRGVEVRVCCAPLAALLRRWCGTGAGHKHLPDFTFDADGEFQFAVLDGVLAGDGAQRHKVITFTQTSPMLQWQVRQLAATHLDSFASVVERDDGDDRHATQYRSNVSLPWLQTHRRVLADDAYVYRPIAAVHERHYAGTVYNFEVADDHSYVSDFAIHNCDWELLDEHSEGLIVTSGCLGGHVLQALLRDDYDGAVKAGGRLQDIFGRDSFFIELQDHGIPEQRRTNPQLLEIAKHLQAPLLATNDSHYVAREDSVAHDALLCVQTGSLMSDPDRFKFHGDEHYLKSAREMRYLFDELPEACDNTLWIAERATVEIEFGKPQLPSFPLPEGFTTDGEYLTHLTMEGARKRWGTNVPDRVVERLAYELQVIESMGFSSYFLIVWDLIKHARDNGIRVGPGRGSAAGCAVAYCLWITDLDPIKYDLLFERFLNPSRISMPDIDMDFDSRYRDEMIRYAAERYGRDHVAQIVTFSTIKARAAVRDAARVLGYPYVVGDKVAKAMPPLVMGRDTPLYACLEPHPKFEDGYKMAADLRKMRDEDPDAAKVIEVAKGLEGLRRQDGIHAAAVVITKEPLTTYLPIQRKPEAGKDIEDAPIVTQYEMHGVEELGLLKMDFLGLRNLDVISDALEIIEQSRGIRLDIDAIPLDDQPTLELLCRGDSIGVFQLEGGPMRSLMRSLAPSSFEDVAALVALYRPGPMAANMHNDYADRKNGRKPVEYFHPDAEELLADTYGLMIYQESVMRVAQKFAGYSLAQADNLRKACGKKVRELMAKERAAFVDGVEATGYDRALGTQLFDIIEQFADYAFNKSHSFGYGYIAYQTAYLKAHHPAEYLAALLTSVKANLDKAAVYLAECRTMGIEVLVPDVNRSESEFTPLIETNADGTERPSIVFGLSAVRNVGEGLVRLLLAEREANGPFADFYDFCERVDFQVLNKKTLESLIKAGGFDSLGHPRQGLLRAFEHIVDTVVARRRERDMGVMSLFGDVEDAGPLFDERPPIPDLEFAKRERLSFEKEMLGLYVSDHPLMGAEASLRRKCDGSLVDVVELDDGAIRTFGGVITSLQRKWTKKGDLMAVFSLEDLQTSIEVMVFPKTMTDHGHKLADDAVVVVKARVDARDEQPKLIAMDIEPFEPMAGEAFPLRLKVAAAALSESLIEELKRLLGEHPGDSPVLLHLGERQVLRLPPAWTVDVAPALLAELRVLLGPTAIVA